MEADKEDKEIENQAVRIMKEAVERIESEKKIAIFIVTVSEGKWSRCILAPHEPFENSQSLAVEAGTASKILSGAIYAERIRRQEAQKYN